ncbi:Acyl-CoA:1-acyl-sn-glycerol-3-phosphate acyltransferase [hydrothermal vent metagenome]|uniref:Acyl-CoA:1-acyl-sn-glycerol-3-phosphate acyltransferase n=1 Tax=hydrothermal vent metagenome TaxID=652676 RepID=A0A3B0Y0S8_9ZZZZ
MINRILQILFFALFIKPLILIIIGLNCRFRDKLPKSGPAVIAANHNSHLDTFVLMCLYPLSEIHRLRPVAAADYFMRGGLLGWFSLTIMRIIPIDRKNCKSRKEMFQSCHDALDNGDILILFPEGTRGEPEKQGELKKGIYHLIRNRSDTEVTPIVMHGLGRSLPRGEALFIPFNCDVVIGDSLAVTDSAQELLEKLSASYEELKTHCITRVHDS